MRHRLCIPDTCEYLLKRGSSRQRLSPCYACIDEYNCTVKPDISPCNDCRDRKNCCEDKNFKYTEEVCDFCDLKFYCLTTVK